MGQGYSRSASFSRDLDFGKAYRLRARQAPLTMCVSATMEVIVTALDIYARETGDYAPFSYLPTSSWERLRPVDLRAQIWIVKHSASQGTAHALQKFGMGTVRDFRDITPGAFVNLNRNNRTGHAVIFLGYLDARGKPVAR